MSFTYDFTTPFFGGAGGSSSAVPDQWDVAINGHPYMLDINSDAFNAGLQTIPLLRNQSDAGTEPGEASINPEDLWSRSQQSWHHGAGQEFLDRSDSDRQRFYSSRGIDPWTQGVLKPLHVTYSRSSAFTGFSFVTAIRVGDYTYLAGGPTLQRTLDSNTWTAVTGVPTTIKSITTDGYNVWTAHGASGVYLTTRGGTTTASYNALSTTLLGYAKGRLLAANGNAIYNITSTTTPSALFTHPNTDFTWVGFAEGTGFIYAAGYSGDKSIIYKTAVKADGTALDIPTVAATLPDGEVVYSIQGYLGFVVVGTATGFRLATEDNAGNLTFGALVEIGTPVRCFEPQEQYMWFGWTNYKNTSTETYTGIGRMDLSVFTAPNVPAYASDLMAVTTGNVNSIVTDAQGNRCFTIQNGAFWAEGSATLGPSFTAAYVGNAEINMGKVDYGLGDDKIALRLKLRHKPLATGQSVDAYVSVDSDDYAYVGTSDSETTTGPGNPLRVSELPGRTFEVRLLLNGAVEFERYDLQAYPAAARGRTILVPLLLTERVQTANLVDTQQDPKSEYDFLTSFIGADRPVVYQELGSTFSAFIEEVQFQRRDVTDDRTWWNGTAVLRLKALAE